MSAWQAWGAVIGLAVGTFLIRYSFIGLFAKRDIPPWVEHGLKFMVPAVFAAIVFSGVLMSTGRLTGLEQWPRYAAALIALAVALKTNGNLPLTVLVGMVALHALPWLLGLLF